MAPVNAVPLESSLLLCSCGFGPVPAHVYYRQMLTLRLCCCWNVDPAVNDSQRERGGRGMKK